MGGFQYDPEILAACATGNEHECVQLFSQHQAHYQRTRTSTTTESIHYSNLKGYQQFLESVRFIYEHERNIDHDGNISSDFKRDTYTHHVSLNQFSDLSEDDLPLYEYEAHQHNLDANANVIPIEKEEDAEYFLRQMKGYRVRPRTTSGEHHYNDDDFLSSADHDIAVKSERKKEYRNGNVGKRLEDSRRRVHHRTQLIEFNSDPEDFSTHLNWATGENPDGVPLVHRPIDQGSCGSCWAIAATGTLEAIASRRVGYDAYHTHMKMRSTSSSKIASSSSTPSSNVGEEEDLIRGAIEAAQNAELEAFHFANLSIQELVDCDTQYDLGCTGGNPVSAFHYIHKRGLVASNSYPYVGSQGRCHLKRIMGPIATAESWGKLKSDDEENMQMVLRHFGPIAVGMNGSDKSFIHYKSGIFDSKKCHKHPNHAMLIVGYGEESREERLVKYWIARNSWGGDWGENGYIRVARRNKRESVCGISRDPSIALGGTLLGSFALTKTHMEYGRVRVDEDIHGKKASVLRGNETLEGKVKNPGHLFYSQPEESCRFIPFILIFIFFNIVIWKRHRLFVDTGSASRVELKPSLVQNRTKIKTYGSIDEG